MSILFSPSSGLREKQTMPPTALVDGLLRISFRDLLIVKLGLIVLLMHVMSICMGCALFSGAY